MNGSIITSIPNGQPILVNCPNGQQLVAASNSPALSSGGRGLPALLMPTAHTHHLTPSHVLTCSSPSTATTVITPNPTGLIAAANCPVSFAYYNSRMANASVVQLPAPGTIVQAQQQANGVIAQANGCVPQQQPQHQMSVVLGRRSDLTRPLPSKWLACCCCLLPLWYANCNIYRVSLIFVASLRSL